MKKNNTWIKVVITIIILEVLVGAVIFAYKKLNANDNKVSTDDKIVQELYQKIAYYDIESLDVMNSRTMLYYGYKNVGEKTTINCDSVGITDDTTGYSCVGDVEFTKRDLIEDEIKDIYGNDVTIETTSFETDPNHYAFYDPISDGYVLYTKDEQINVDPVNLKLDKATTDDDGNIILTVNILDGVFGTVKETYNFTFTKDNNNYYLTSKELVTSKEE